MPIVYNTFIICDCGGENGDRRGQSGEVVVVECVQANSQLPRPVQYIIVQRHLATLLSSTGGIPSAIGYFTNSECDIGS